MRQQSRPIKQLRCAAWVVIACTFSPCAYTSYRTPSDFTDTTTSPAGGVILMGGSVEPDAAMRWMITRMDGGDFVVLRASGSDGYNDYIYRQLGGVNSVETIVFDSRDDSYRPEIAATIRNAEGLWMAGGDQALYISYWKDSPVEEAIQYLIDEKKAVVGGTSAGCAVMTPVYFSAAAGSVGSSDALAAPRQYAITAGVGIDDFLRTPFLRNTISDTHYAQRNRQGRHTAFVAHMLAEGLSDVKGIGVDERTAVCIDENGRARVFGTNCAYFLRQYCGPPEVCREGAPLTWSGGVDVYRIPATASGSGFLELTDWKSGAGAIREYWHVDAGTMTTSVSPAQHCPVVRSGEHRSPAEAGPSARVAPMLSAAAPVTLTGRVRMSSAESATCPLLTGKASSATVIIGGIALTESRSTWRGGAATR